MLICLFKSKLCLKYLKNIHRILTGVSIASRMGRWSTSWPRENEQMLHKLRWFKGQISVIQSDKFRWFKATSFGETQLQIPVKHNTLLWETTTNIFVQHGDKVRWNPTRYFGLKGTYFGETQHKFWWSTLTNFCYAQWQIFVSHPNKFRSEQ